MHIIMLFSLYTRTPQYLFLITAKDA